MLDQIDGIELFPAEEFDLALHLADDPQRPVLIVAGKMWGIRATLAHDINRLARADQVHLDPRLQLEAVLQCFGKGRTTTASPGRGFGLWKVLSSLIGLRGFISVRTNSIHAFRQFGYTAATGQEELPGGQRVPKEQLYDWKRGLSTEPSEYPHVQGTVISFLIPMGQE